MSRVRQELSIVQFQVENRQASASMEALRERAKKLNEDITAANASIKALGNVAPDDAGLLAFQKKLKGLNSDLRDVTRAQNELMKGVKAADKLWKAAATGTMESLSVKEIKAGQRGIQTRMQNLQPTKENARELQAMKIAIEEGEIAMRKFEADAERLVKTIREGGSVSSNTLSKAKTDLQGLLDYIPQGTKEWNRYNQQLTTVSEKLRELTVEQQRATGKDTLGRAFRGDFAMADAKTLEQIITKLKEYQSVIDDPQGKGARHFAAAKTQIEALTTQLNKTKGVIATVEAAMQKATDITGRQVTSASEHIARATAATRSNIATVEGKIESTTAEIRQLESAMDAINQPQNIAPLIAQMEQTTAEIQRQHTAKEQFIKTSEQEHLARERAIEEQRAMVAWAVAEKKAYENNIKSLEGQIKYEEEHLKLLKETQAQMRTQKDGTVAPPSAEDLALIEQHEKIIAKIKERKAAMEAANKTTSQLTEANERLAAAIKADEEATAQAQKAIQAFDAQIASTESSVTQLQQQMNAMYNPATVKQMEAELANLTEEFNRQKEARAQLLVQSEAERAERQRNIDSLKQQIATLKEENQRALDGYIAKSNAIDNEMAKLRTLQRVREKNAQAIEKDNFTEDKAFTEKTGWKPKSLEERYPLENIDRMIESTQRSIAALEKERDAMDASLTSTSEKLGTATKDLEQATREHAQATETARNAIRQYDEQIKKLETDIANYTQQLQAAKSAQNTQEYQRMAQQLQQLQGNLASMVAEREKYVATMQQEEEAAKRLAEAEKAEAVAAQQNVTQEQVEQSIKVLEDNRRKIVANTDEWNRQGAALEVLQEKLRQMKGEMMSFADAQALADKAMEEQALTTKTGWAASTEELKHAEQTLADKVAKAKRGTAEEEAAYQKLVRQLQAVRTELSAGSMSGKQMMDVLANPKNVTSVDTLKAAIGRARQELDALGRRLDQAKQSGQNGEVKKLQKAYDELAKSVQQTDIRMKELQNSSKGTSSAFEKAWSRLKTYVGLYVGAAVAMQKIAASMGDLLELSDKMGEVRKTTGMTADEVGRLSDSLAKMDTRRSLVDLMDLASMAGSVGLKSQQDIEGFTKAANQLTVALPEMGNEAARTLIKISNATGDLEKNGGNVEETLQRVGSTIIALRANSASAAGPITDFVSRVGAVGAQTGISIDQIAALGSTIDALGGRVEMSATALSRMIPAIRNNMFSIAAALNMTEKELKGKTAMEQMVTIFQKLRESVKGIDTSTEEGMNAMADNVEALLGRNATMGEVMKELNQQGARAGIVFGLLSQNVDELQKQLGIASDAYSQNTALMNEYNNMNETAAAKWARLKNQLEEFFVSDANQKFLSGIIDFLRKGVDLLTGSGGWSVALRTILLYVSLVRLQLVSIAKGALTSIAGGLKNIGITLGFIKGEMTALQWSNVFTALGAAVLYLFTQLKQAKDALAETRKELGKWAQEILKSEQAVEENFKAVDKANVSIDEANKKLRQAQTALEKARKEMDGSKESAERLKKAEEDLKKAEDDVRKASDAHKASIEQINKLYGSYLGFMLSEISSAKELANARELINAKLRETITLKRKEAALGRIEENLGGDRDEAYGALSQALGSAVRKKVKVGGKEVWTTDQRASTELLREITKRAQGEKLTAKEVEQILSDAGLSIYETTSGGKQKITAYGANLRNLVMNYRREYLGVQKQIKDVETQFDVEASVDREETQRELGEQYTAAVQNYTKLESAYAKATGDARKKAAANLLKQMDTINEMVDNSANYYDLTNKDEKASYDQFVAGNEERIKGMREQREALLKEAGEAYKPRTKVGGGSTVPHPTNPYGNFNRVTSPYQDWNADALVARRKEMLERVRALANGADVQAVLSEDAKFISEATRNNIKTTRQAIEWYNTERLKIQDALHEKHLTNTGNWMDPKKGGKKASKLVQDEMKYYLDELDAYYTERKTRIQEAATEEGITEAEMKNRTLANEMEWHQRRAELQKLYAKKSAEVAKEEQDAIFGILSDRTGETTDYIEKDIASTVKFIEKVGKEKGRPAMDRIMGDLDLGIERDFLKQQQAVTTQMKAIRDIIEKERPYDGITKNLRENLVTMGILTADMTAERNRLMRENADMSEFNSRQANEELKRTAFVLREAENAYSTTIEEVMRHMGEQGMAAWADAIRGDKQMQQALMAQLRTAYDQIQDAIKKEASLIKKQTDIWWADIEKGQTESRRDGFEKMLSRLGLAEDQVKRANSLIGAGQASERVADKLAIKQMEVRLAMLQTYYNRMRKIGEERIEQLEKEGRMEDAEHLRRSLNLAKTEELKKLEEQRVAIANQLEESQNRLYTELKSWADLLTSSLQSVFEASNAGNAEYYNELAKLNLTGKGGPGAGTYIVIDNEGTSDATAHYEYLDEREALERQHEIERENAQAEAWKKVMDDINMKMSETITDQLNAMLQNASVDANTDAVNANTTALGALSEQLAQGVNVNVTQGGEDIPLVGEDGLPLARAARKRMGLPVDENPHDHTQGSGELSPAAQQQIDESNLVTETIVNNAQKQAQATADNNKKMQTSAQSTFAKMTLAANMYGIAYQAMSNDNLSTTQKFEMMALQAVGNYAIGALTTEMAAASAKAATDSPGVLGTLWKQLGWAAAPVFAIFTGLLGGLMGLATSKISKAKSTIAQATGSSSASAGRLTTGMLTYAEGNVNEFTDPSTLTPGRQYDVDAADGRTYRARYMGTNPRTHITNGPEFHLSGERGREMIIDAGTTRQITMNEGEIWHAIQTLSGGGRISASRRRGRGVRAFAEGNLDDFDGSVFGDSVAETSPGMTPDMAASMQASLDANTAVLQRALDEGFRGVFNVYGKDGLVDSYDRGKKTLNRYGERY